MLVNQQRNKAGRDNIRQRNLLKRLACRMGFRFRHRGFAIKQIRLIRRAAQRHGHAARMVERPSTGSKRTFNVLGHRIADSCA